MNPQIATTDVLPIHRGTTLANIEKLVILATLEANSGNKTHTARELDISIRALRMKLKQWEAAE